MKNLYKVCAIFSGVVLLNACGSTPKNNEYLNEFSSINTNAQPIYARIVKDSENNYKFDSYSLSNKANMVNLKTMQHSFSTEESECSQSLGILASNKSGLCNTDENLFRTSTVDAGDLAANTIGNAFVGYVTLGTGMSAYYTTEFDEEEFVKALKQAEAKINRKNLLVQAQKSYDSAQQKLNSNREQFSIKLKEISIKLPHHLVIQDNSKLFNENITVEARLNSTIKPKIGTGGSWRSIPELEKILNNRVKEYTHEGLINLSCPQIKEFNFDIQGCQQSWSYNDPVKLSTISYSISSLKNYAFNATPIIEDQFIKIYTDNRSNVTITNKTDKFLTLDNLSLYLGKDIFSLSDLGIELSPHAEKESALTLFKFNGYRAKTKLTNVIKKDLYKEVSFGFAAKYRIVDANKEKTLYKTRKSLISSLPNS